MMICDGKRGCTRAAVRQKVWIAEEGSEEGHCYIPVDLCSDCREQLERIVGELVAKMKRDAKP